MSTARADDATAFTIVAHATYWPPACSRHAADARRQTAMKMHNVLSPNCKVKVELIDDESIPPKAASPVIVSAMEKRAAEGAVVITGIILTGAIHPVLPRDRERGARHHPHTQDGARHHRVEQSTRMALKTAVPVHLMRSGKVVLSEPAVGIDLGRLHDLDLARENTQ